VTRYVAARDLEKLARYWVAGSDVRGAGLDEASSGRVVALPLYPFARSRVTPARAPVAADDGRPRELNGSSIINGRDVAPSQGS
jgi:hypothetical protein